MRPLKHCIKTLIKNRIVHTAFQNRVIVNIFSALELLFEIETLKTETTIAVANSF